MQLLIIRKNLIIKHAPRLSFMSIQPVYDAFFLYIRKYFIHSQYEKSCQSIISSGSFMIIYYLLIHNTHTLINPFLYHLSTYIKIVGYFINVHSIRSHGQSSFFCLWHHDFIKIESQIADIFQLDDDNTPV